MIATKNRVTINEVAQKANVTAQTVSRVMRGVDYVSDQTRRKVLDAARALNYIPSYAAKALRNGMRRSIAIVFDSLRNVYFSIMIDHLRKEIVSNGYGVQLIFSDNVVITEESYRKAISHGAVAVISFLEGEQGLGEIVKECGIPLMIFGRSTDDDGLDYVTTDDEQGGRLAARYLLKQKCSSFKYLVVGSGMTCAIDRCKGFIDELKLNGYDAEVLDIDLMGDGAFSAIDITDPACGVFCFNDILAFQLINRMSRDIRVLRAKVVGYDNVQSDIVLPITLTTIGIDKSRHAKLAVDSILSKLSSPDVRFAVREQVFLYEGKTA